MRQGKKIYGKVNRKGYRDRMRNRVGGILGSHGAGKRGVGEVSELCRLWSGPGVHHEY
jgi:hypothetical protein